MGSSKTQTTTQTAAAIAHTQSTLEDISICQPIIFMDRSALGNPGPCRAAAVCFPEGLISEPVVCDLSVSKCSSSYHGELCAIRLATAFSVSYSDTHLIRQIHIFSDCKSAIASSSSADSATNNAEYHISLFTLKVLTRRNTRRKWQRVWNRSDSILHELFPAIIKLGYKSLHHRPADLS